MALIPKIGLEVHLELKTKTKMFCSCLNDSEEIHPNVNVCEICTGQPGTLPAINKQAVILTLKIIRAVGGHIQSPSVFARKNYFYPDLPKNYQISQYELPLGVGGELNFHLGEELKKVRIRRIHLEEDTGKLIHMADDSLVDFNRSGVPLMEIVTEPDITSSGEAKAFVDELILLIRYLDISGANPEKGEIRLEANISVKNQSESVILGTKVEVKNLNSLRALQGSIEYEIARQKQVVLSGEKVIQETRGWDETTQKTFSQRTKEEAEDYRYFPEPDLPPLLIDQALLKEATLPELPNQKRERFKRDFNLSDSEVGILVRQPELANFFEEAVSEAGDMAKDEAVGASISSSGNLLFNYLVNDLAGLLSKFHKNLNETQITPHQFSHLISRAAKGEYSSKIVKEILQIAVEKGENIEELMKTKIKITNEATLKTAVEEILRENSKAVEDYKGGKGGSFEFLIGQIMKKTQGQADTEITRMLLKQILG